MVQTPFIWLIWLSIKRTVKNQPLELKKSSFPLWDEIVDSVDLVILNANLKLPGASVSRGRDIKCLRICYLTNIFNPETS